MNGGNRRAWIIRSMALLFLVAFVGCQNYEDVIVREKEVTANDAERAKRLLSSAREYLNSELYPQAEAASREVLDIEPDNKGAYSLLGTALWRQEKHDEVFSLYQTYTEKFPEDPDGYARLAAVYGDRGDYATAAQKMQKAVALNPEDATLHGDLGHYYAQLEMWDEAQEPYEKAVELEPDNDAYQQMLSKVYQELGKTDELLASQKALLEKDAENKKLMASVARLSIEQGDYDTALDLYVKLVADAPDDIALQNNLAVIQLRSGDTTAAAATYQKVLELDPSDADGYIRLADLQSSDAIRNYQAAVQNVQTGLNLNPSSARGWSIWGKILERQGSTRDDPNDRIERYRQAITKFEKAAELSDPTWSEYARREIQRQKRLIEIEEAKIKKREYDQLEEL